MYKVFNRSVSGYSGDLNVCEPDGAPFEMPSDVSSFDIQTKITKTMLFGLIPLEGRVSITANRDDGKDSIEINLSMIPILSLWHTAKQLKAPKEAITIPIPRSGLYTMRDNNLHQKPAWM